MTRLFRRYVGRHRHGQPTQWLPVAVDPWAVGEALDTLTDTVVLRALEVA